MCRPSWRKRSTRRSKKICRALDIAPARSHWRTTATWSLPLDTHLAKKVCTAQTSPTDVFRVGSLSKVITAIAVHQLDETLPLLNKNVAPLLGLTFKDKKGEDIWVRHLLSHTGGIPKNAGVKLSDGSLLANDLMEYDRFVKPGTLPVDKDMVFEFVTGLDGFVTTTPGDVSKYSNTGYDFLGEAVRTRADGDLMGRRKKVHLQTPGYTRRCEIQDSSLG